MLIIDYTCLTMRAIFRQLSAEGAVRKIDCTGWTVSIPAGRYTADSSSAPSHMVEPHSLTAPARDRILEAAERLVADVGAARLTLDAVAQGAGVSKGGFGHPTCLNTSDATKNPLPAVAP